MCLCVSSTLLLFPDRFLKTFIHSNITKPISDADIVRKARVKLSTGLLKDIGSESHVMIWIQMLCVSTSLCQDD